MEKIQQVLKQFTILIMLITTLIGKQAFACLPPPPHEDPTDSKEIVELKIGQTYFRFPESFFYDLPDRLPVVRDYVYIRVYLPDFTPPPEMPPVLWYKHEASIQWEKDHPYVSIYIGKRKEDVNGYSDSTPKYPLNDDLEFIFDRNILTPETVKEKLRPYMYTKPSVNWDKDQKLAEALHSINYRYVAPCILLVPGEQAKPVPPPPLVPMDIIEQGLSHKNQAIRASALQQLSRHENSEEVANRLYSIASNDKQDGVRISALNGLIQYKSTVDIIPMLTERLKKETNDEAIQIISRYLSSHEKSKLLHGQ